MAAPKEQDNMDWRDRIESVPGVLDGKLVIKGTPIAVALVDQLLTRGYTAEAIVSNLLDITTEDVEACRQYGREQRERDRAEFVRNTPKRTPANVVHWQERIVCVPGVLSGKPVIKGTRLSVEFITDLLEGGYRTPEDVVQRYPQIRLADVEACLLYKATGAPLSKTTWADIDALMDGKRPPRL